MNTGCQGPFCHGTGGWCGCNCKCCPPPCCPVITVFFDCGAPQSTANPGGCVFSPPVMPMAWSEISVPLPAPIPEFSQKPIISEDKRFMFGAGVSNCSVPCQTICVELKCGGLGMPCCCLELIDGKILSVGNGYVTAPATVEIPGCLTATVLINGLPPPVFVQDCQEVIVTLVTNNDCCTCEQVDAKCGTCPIPILTFASSFAKNNPLWKRKIDARSGKTKINPKSGKPILGIDKNELIKRILNRMKKSRRRKN